MENKVTVFLLAFILIFGSVRGQIEEVYCNHIIGSTICLLNYLQLTETNYRFKPINLGEWPQLTVIISNEYQGYSNVPVLSSDLCETFPEIRQYEIAEVNLHTIQADAFVKCLDLESLDIHGNPIKQFPPNMLTNQAELVYIYFHRLKVQKLDDNLFGNLKKLELLEIPYGALTEFSPNIVRPLTSLTHLDLSVNPFGNLDVDGIRNACPSLTYFFY